MDMPPWRPLFEGAVVTPAVLHVHDGNAASPGPVYQSLNIVKYDVASVERPAQMKKANLGVNNEESFVCRHDMSRFENGILKQSYLDLCSSSAHRTGGTTSRSESALNT